LSAGLLPFSCLCFFDLSKREAQKSVSLERLSANQAFLTIAFYAPAKNNFPKGKLTKPFQKRGNRE
jgi:hypothetical protein